jgi:hypothetical protein
MFGWASLALGDQRSDLGGKTGDVASINVSLVPQVYDLALQRANLGTQPGDFIGRHQCRLFGR